jgi:DNA-binding MarR family transcriptional regulator
MEQVMAKDTTDNKSELDGLVGYNLKRAYVTVRTDFMETLGKENLSPRVFSVLSLCVSHPNITQSELARMIGIERSGLVAMVDDLEKRNYVERRPVPHDRRVQALVPTETGIKAHKVASEMVRAHEERLLSHMSKEEQATLIKLLQKIRAIDAE